MPNGSKRKRILQYAAGMAAESAWILGMTLFAFLMAVVAIWMFR
jgi:hypothetical protein